MKSYDEIVSDVQNNYDLTLSELLVLLKERTGISAFQLAVIAEVDTGAFNKIMNGREGRLLHHDEIEKLIRGVSGISELDARFSHSETNLWLMALQSAAAADASARVIRRHNSLVSSEDLLVGRRNIVETMRRLWIDTGGAFPVVNSNEMNKIVLKWKENPCDLDLYLKFSPKEGGRDYYIFHNNRGTLDDFPNIALDNDIRTGYGPETIEIKVVADGTYTCYVYNCSGERKLAGCGATIEALSTVFEVPLTGEGRSWKVFSFDTIRNEILLINKIDDDASYIVKAMELFGHWPNHNRLR